MLRGMLEATIAGGACWLFAEAAPSTPLGLSPWSAGATGFTVWYAWYTTSRVIPQLVKDFREESRLSREESKADRDAYLRGLDALHGRDRHKENA